MKSFKEVIKRRLYWKVLYAILGGLVFIITIIIKLNIRGNISMLNGVPMEVLFGMFMGTEFICVYRITRYRKAIRSSEMLEVFHIKETDERNHTITLKTCRSCIQISIILLGLVAIITAFFNQMVYFTVSIILIVILVLYGVLWLYYTRKY